MTTIIYAQLKNLRPFIILPRQQLAFGRGSNFYSGADMIKKMTNKQTKLKNDIQAARPTTKAAPAMPGVPCFLCKAKLIPRQTYKEKPYIVCDNCGIQTFIRGIEGRRLFQKLIDDIILADQKKRGR
jgi:DNA-directed RNA polymerase subunit RPC12/RpoP